MLYTRKGDDGTTTTFGESCRIPKHHPHIEALGALDELCSLIGICKSEYKFKNNEMVLVLEGVQNALFTIQAEVAGAQKHIRRTDVIAVEKSIADIERVIERPQSFVLPGATKTSALLDFARAVSRRTERDVLAIGKHVELGAESRRYLNRLSSLLYALARQEAQKAGVETPPSYLSE